MEVAHSVNNVPIRLTDERWIHIVENHDDLAGRRDETLRTVETPDMVVKGQSGELLAVQLRTPLSLVVIYKEISHTEGFIITAFQTSKIKSLLKTRKTIWRTPQ